jgi:hypothetical protein
MHICKTSRPTRNDHSVLSGTPYTPDTPAIRAAVEYEFPPEVLVFQLPGLLADRTDYTAANNHSDTAALEALPEWYLHFPSYPVVGKWCRLSCLARLRNPLES